tara:strand:- start:261 stop:452 length:192 start_codon:yes stop_codon:yes gene_type:complete
MMMRQTAVDMENLLNVEEKRSVHMFRQKYLGISCLLILTHSFSFSLGYMLGYMSINSEGSNNI